MDPHSSPDYYEDLQVNQNADHPGQGGSKGIFACERSIDKHLIYRGEGQAEEVEAQDQGRHLGVLRRKLPTLEKQGDNRQGQYKETGCSRQDERDNKPQPFSQGLRRKEQSGNSSKLFL